MRYSHESIEPSIVCAAIYDKKGVVQYAADSIPCHPCTIFRMMKTHPKVKQAVEDAREQAQQERIDKNEVLREKAYKSVEVLLDDFDTTTTIFTLKSLCGWLEAKQDPSTRIEVIQKPYSDKDNRDSTPVPV